MTPRASGASRPPPRSVRRPNPPDPLKGMSLWDWSRPGRQRRQRGRGPTTPAPGAEGRGLGGKAPQSVASSQRYTACDGQRFLDTGEVREEPQRVDGRLEATLRVPDVDPAAIVVIAHALPTHGGTMRTPIMAAIARACAERGWYALRFNFRGVGESAGEWTGGRHETDDVAAAVDYARTIAPGLPLGLVGYSFGAFQILAFLERGGRAAAVA